MAFFRMLVNSFACAVAEANSDSLHLLQTHAQVQVHAHAADSEGLHLRETKECKAAKRARRDTKKQWKTDRAALKAARAALKTARSAHSTSKEAYDATLAALTTACPAAAPEVSQAPDVGCSTELITSYEPKNSRSILGIPPQSSYNGFPASDWYGFTNLTKGDGVSGSAGGKKLGIGVMQPCSQAWTGGEFKMSPAIDWRTGRYTGLYSSLGQAYLQKSGQTKSACECREWAETVMPWPKGGVVDFRGKWGGNWYSPGDTVCRVWAMVDHEKIPWNRGGFSMQINGGDPVHMACYLGNPEEWADRVAKQKAEISPQILDKCTKDYWASGELTATGGWPTFHVGTLTYPDPRYDTVEGRKQCLKWVKADPRCADAIGIRLKAYQGVNGMCECVTSSGRMWSEGNRQAGPTPTSSACLL